MNDFKDLHDFPSCKTITSRQFQKIKNKTYSDYKVIFFGVNFILYFPNSHDAT